MSELIQRTDNRATIRWKLLTGASALALTAYVSSVNAAMAEDSDRPLIWLEVNGQLNRLSDSQEIYTPPFVALTPPPFESPTKTERPPLYSLDEGGSITFQPEDSNWIFSASVQYGRAGKGKHTHHQSYPAAYSKYVKEPKYVSYKPVQPVAARFTDAKVKQTESHTIIDFQAGKDLGLGMFGHDSTSSLNLGVRFVQFTSKTRVTLGEGPDWHFSPQTYFFNYYGYQITFQEVFQPYHSFAGAFRADRSFHGVGPSLSWKSSMPFAGNSQDGELALDWDVNAALLFGRQRTKTHHQTTAHYHPGGSKYNHPARYTLYAHNHPSQTRSRNVTVPNVGGSVGLSWQLQNFKASFGYKADFFFGAMDGGIDTRKNENRAFYGPFASISIGLGD